MRSIQINDNLENKISMLKDILQQITGMQFSSDEEFIEFLVDWYLQSFEWHHSHWWGWCCGGGCGCSH